MVTLSDIKQAVAILPLPEQEELYRSLDERLHRRASISSASRHEWLARLAALRQQTQANDSGQPDSQKILEELREDR